MLILMQERNLCLARRKFSVEISHVKVDLKFDGACMLQFLQCLVFVGK